jgi:uncharacterized spore protein YtfJ
MAVFSDRLVTATSVVKPSSQPRPNYRAHRRSPKKEPYMSSLALVQSLHENLAKNAGVRSVFGEPVIAGDKTILPVARVAYGFGAGGGAGGAGEKNKGEGGGGGGGVRINPAGVFVIDPAGNQFLAVHDRKRSIGLLLAGVCLGMLLARSRKERVSRLRGLRLP